MGESQGMNTKWDVSRVLCLYSSVQIEFFPISLVQTGLQTTCLLALGSFRSFQVVSSRSFFFRA